MGFGRYLSLGEAERRGQLDALRRGQVALDFEPLLQAGKLRVGENRAGFPAATVLARQLRVRVGLEERRHGHTCGEQDREPVGGEGDSAVIPPPRSAAQIFFKGWESKFWGPASASPD